MSNLTKNEFYSDLDIAQLVIRYDGFSQGKHWAKYANGTRFDLFMKYWSPFVSYFTPGKYYVVWGKVHRYNNSVTIRPSFLVEELSTEREASSRSHWFEALVNAGQFDAHQQMEVWEGLPELHNQFHNAFLRKGKKSGVLEML